MDFELLCLGKNTETAKNTKESQRDAKFTFAFSFAPSYVSLEGCNECMVNIYYIKLSFRPGH